MSATGLLTPTLFWFSSLYISRYITINHYCYNEPLFSPNMQFKYHLKPWICANIKNVCSTHFQCNLLSWQIVKLKLTSGQLLASVFVLRDYCSFEFVYKGKTISKKWNVMASSSDVKWEGTILLSWNKRQRQHVRMRTTSLFASHSPCYTEKHPSTRNINGLGNVRTERVTQ